MNIYDFEVRTSGGETFTLKKYEGKVLLIVNTATKCGLTPQYEALEALYQKYKADGLEILDFPCNQFMNQTPGSEEEIDSFCSLTYGTTFPRFAKTDVNGKNAHPLFAYLRQEKSADKGDEESVSFEKKVKLMKPLAKPGDVKWNFGKFLVDREGRVVERYSPAYVPEKLEEEICALLKA